MAVRGLSTRGLLLAGPEPGAQSDDQPPLDEVWWAERAAQAQPWEALTGTGRDTAAARAVEPVPSAEPRWAVPGVPLSPAGPAPALVGLREALSTVRQVSPVSGSRADTALLWELAEQARALALRELAEMHAVGGHLREGVRSTAASWLRDTRHLTDGAARAHVGLARTLRDDLPELGQELAEGRITVEHAQAVVAGVRGLDKDVVRAAEKGICELARLTDPVDLRKRLRDKAVAIDDRIAAEVERRARERMGLRLADVGSHTVVDGTLAGEDGATVRLAMTLAAEAARVAGDTRGRAARQADVLVGWAAGYLHAEHGPGDSLADDAHTVRTHLHVVCTPAQLAACAPRGDAAPAGRAAAGTDRPGPEPAAGLPAGLLARDLAGRPDLLPAIVGDRGSLSLAALRRLGCDATVDLIVLPDSPAGPADDAADDAGLPGVRPDPPARADPPGDRADPPGDRADPPGDRADPLYVGRSNRTVSGRQFRALVTRDRTCVVRGCHRPPAACAAHHVRHWCDGGLTDLDKHSPCP